MTWPSLASLAALIGEHLVRRPAMQAPDVYKNLQAASLNNHLPAFEACN